MLAKLVCENLVLKAFARKCLKVMNSYIKKVAVLFITSVQISCCLAQFSKFFILSLQICVLYYSMVHSYINLAIDIVSRWW